MAATKRAMIWWWSLVGIGVLGVVRVTALSTVPLIPPRHVCLLDSYEKTKGPYLVALLDQLLDQARKHNSSSNHHNNQTSGPRVAFCCCKTDEAVAKAQLKAMEEDFWPEFPGATRDGEDGGRSLVILDDFNPETLFRLFETALPEAVWVLGTNAYELRYKTRTSGLDKWMEAHCAGPAGSPSVVMVGQGAAVLCAGAQMAASKILGHDPQAAPEPQFNGWGLLGLQTHLAFWSLPQQENDQTASSSVRDALEASSIQVLEPDRVWVWSQAGDSVQNFVYCPSKRGTIENWAPLSRLDALPPLLVDPEALEGVPCFGEPSIDPSRSLQTSLDSDWIDGN